MTKRYAEAEANFEKALAGREEQLQNAAPGEPLTLGPELGVAEACRHYGILKQAQGKLEDAEA